MTKAKLQNRQRRGARVRAKIFGTAQRPRVSVFKSNKHIFVQLIDDVAGKTLISSKIVTGAKADTKVKKTDKAAKVGEMLAKKAQEAGIKTAVFDKGGFKFHGRVKAVAEGLRQGGIKI